MHVIGADEIQKLIQQTSFAESAATAALAVEGSSSASSCAAAAACLSRRGRRFFFDSSSPSAASSAAGSASFWAAAFDLDLDWLFVEVAAAAWPTSSSSSSSSFFRDFPFWVNKIFSIVNFSEFQNTLLEGTPLWKILWICCSVWVQNRRRPLLRAGKTESSQFSLWIWKLLKHEICLHRHRRLNWSLLPHWESC